MKNLKRMMGLFGVTLASLGFVSVAKADTTAWDTFKTCMQDSGTKSCTLDSTVVAVNEELTVKGNITLDLNKIDFELLNRIILDDTGNLTIKNGNLHRDDRSTIVTVRKGTTLTLENVSLTGIDDNVTVIGIVGADSGNDKTTVNINANATVNGTVGIADNNGKADGVVLNIRGTINGNNSDGVTINGNVGISTNGPVVNIYDTAIISSNVQGIYAAGYGTWNIEGGMISGNEGIGIKSGKFNITGGYIYGNGEYVPNPVEESGKVTATGSAISITTNEAYAGDVEISISGDTEVYSTNAYAIYEGPTGIEDTAVKEFEISDGYFEGAKGSLNIISKDKEAFKNSITGGAFTSQIDESLLAANSKAEVLNFDKLNEASEEFSKTLEEGHKLAESLQDKKLNAAQTKALKNLEKILSNYGLGAGDLLTTQAAIDEATEATIKSTEELSNAIKLVNEAKDLVTFTLVIDDEEISIELEKGMTLGDYKKLLKDDYDIEKFVDKDGKELSLDTEITEGMYFEAIVISPETGDNILTYAGVAAVGTLGLGIALKKRYARN